MKKILTIIYILIFVALSYYVVTMFIGRDHSEVDTQQKEEQADTSKEHSVNSTKNDSIKIEEEITDTIEVSPEEDAAYNITAQDCASRCTDIENTNKTEYCKQVCGLSINTQTDSCDNLSDLEKDYCIKDKSIAEKDMNGCSKILDAGIKKQCQNRINEDFMDEVM